MTHLAIPRQLNRLAAAAVFAALALALLATSAATANVANPDPALIARWEPCAPNTGVTVIVDDHELGEGKIYVGCAPGETANGVEALQRAGFTLQGTETFGLAFICRIDGEPTFAEQDCKGTPGPGAYWSYWRGKPGGRWGYSGIGAKDPLSHSPINSVEGWGFGSGGSPRIEPMDGSGPSSFQLPPAQTSSEGPAQLASPWLASTLDATAAEGERLESEGRSLHRGPEYVLRGVIALAQAGVPAAQLEPIARWLAQSGKKRRSIVEGLPLRRYLGLGGSRERQNTAQLALAVLGLQALGQDPSDFAGKNLRRKLQSRIEKSGLVKSEGEATEAVDVAAPTVLALAHTGALPPRALKTVDLILAEQNANGTGTFEGETDIDVEAIRALVAAREQGSGVLGSERLKAIQADLAKAGEYLEGIQEDSGGVRSAERDEPVFDANVESTALGAVGLALAGHQAAAERAARWVSRYQVTAEYAGEGNKEIGEETPAEDLIGAFLPNEAALRTALAFGLEKEDPYGVFSEAQLPTIDALAAMVTVGPYGS
ncbi:MAG TPA: hypothetical protein VMB05_17255 [Solirubrobacteraceae bacterium]|nr:hypothetical protein [Solirubrobacteraceae bacterium]